MKTFEHTTGVVITHTEKVFIEKDYNGLEMRVASLLNEVFWEDNATMTVPEGRYKVNCIITIEKE